MKQLTLVHRMRATSGKEDEMLTAIRKGFAGPVTFADDRVTGTLTARTTVEAIRSILGRSRSKPAPAPRRAISRTQHPQLMSMKSGPASST